MLRRDNIIPHVSFRETLRNEQSVLSNDVTINGSPTISNGIGNFSPLDYITLPGDVGFHLNAFTMCFRVSLPAIGNNANARLFEGGGNWRFYLDSGSLSLVHDVSGAPQTVSLSVNPYLGIPSIWVTCTCYVSGANIVANIFAGTLTNQSSNAGSIVTNPSSLIIGSNAGIQFWESDIFEFFYVDGYAFTQEDHLALANGVLSSDLKPEENSFILPCNDAYDNGSGNRVTSSLGTVISEAILGDGSTSTSFPTLDRERLFSFDGGDHINCGDYDEFTLSTGSPFSMGAIVQVDAATGSISPIISKLIGIGLGGGEFTFYRNKSDNSLRLLMLDHLTGGYRLLYSTNQIFAGRTKRIVITYDGSGTFDTNTVQFYVDGLAVSKLLATSGVFNTITNTSINLVVGSWSTPATYTTGRIGLPFLMAKELSPLQVQMLDKRISLWRQI